MPSTSRPTWPRDRPAALVVAAAVAAHVRSIGFDFTGLDDRDFIVDDHAFLVGAARAANLPRVFGRSYMHVLDPEHPYYRPLVTLSYALDARWSGLSPWGYHATNVALHALATALVLALLRRLALGAAVTCAAALVFAVHPALASAVAWIPGRTDSLLAVFALGAWIVFLDEARRPSWWRRLAHVALFWAALLTKETAVVVPLLCVAHVVLVDPADAARLWRSPASLVLVGGWVAGIAVRLLVHAFSTGAAAGDAAREAIHALPRLAESLGQLTAPVNPSLLTDPEDLSVWPGLACAALALAALVAHAFAPGIRPRIVALGAAVFVLGLAPVLAVPGALVLGSRLYLPAVGVVIAVAEIVRAAARERSVLVAFSGVTVVALALVTVAFEGTFRDRRVFARSAVVSAPHSALAHFCLGRSLQIDGDADRALGQYRTALALGASYGVHNNIAVLDMAAARWGEAEGELREEIAADPRSVRAFRNLAIVLRHEGRDEDARAAGDRARELDGDTAPP